MKSFLIDFLCLFLLDFKLESLEQALASQKKKFDELKETRDEQARRVSDFVHFVYYLQCWDLNCFCPFSFFVFVLISLSGSRGINTCRWPQESIGKEEWSKIPFTLLLSWLPFKTTTTTTTTVVFQEIKSQSFRLANMETQLEGLKKSSKETALENNKMRSGKDFIYLSHLPTLPWCQLFLSFFCWYCDT